MSDALAGTPPAPQDGTPTGGTPTGTKDGSGSDAQKWEEALKWKQKAEDYNKLEAESRAKDARLAEMERLAYSRGAGQATDPQAELVAKLREAAPYDPASAAALIGLEKAAVNEVELWLSDSTAHLPEPKRSQVKGLIRGSRYQMSVDDALRLVTDPDTVTAKSRLAELEAENARLKERVAQPNGSSPAFAVAASSANDSRETMPWSEVQHTLKVGGDAARALRDKMDGGKLKVDYAR